MPTNITRPNTAQFIVGFLSTSGAAITPSSGTLNMSYYSSGTLVSSDTTLTLSGGYWTANWSTATVDLGDATWSVSSPSTTNPAATGIIRVIDP